MRRVRIAQVLILTSGTLAGCGTPDSSGDLVGDPHWAAAPDDTEIRPLVEHPSMCGDCIGFELEVVLGDRTGPGYVVQTEYAVRDSLGNYMARPIPRHDQGV